MTAPGSDTAPEAGARDDEVTTAMVEAGVRILMDSYDAVGGPVDRLNAEEIFRAMLAKRVAPAGRRSSRPAS